MADLVPHDRRHLVLVLHNVEDARVEPDLAARQHPGVDLVVVEHDEFPVVVAQAAVGEAGPGRLHDALSDARHPRVPAARRGGDRLPPRAGGQRRELAVGNEKQLVAPQRRVLPAAGKGRPRRRDDGPGRKATHEFAARHFDHVRPLFSRRRRQVAGGDVMVGAQGLEPWTR